MRQNKLNQLLPIKEALENYLESFPVITGDYHNVLVSCENIEKAIEKVEGKQ